MYPSYVATNALEMFDQANPIVKDIFKSGEIDTVTTNIAEKYKIPVGSYIALSNVIAFVLVDALQPENVVKALHEMVLLPEDTAKSVGEDLEKGIFQKVRSLIIGKEPVAELTFKGNNKDEALRKELLDTTKRESALTTPQSSGEPAKKASVITPGSRNQLLEQLQVLGTIPNDEEVESRLKHIQEQLANIQSKEEAKGDTPIIRQTVLVKAYDFGENADKAVQAVKQTAPYSTAPTKYNVDPYREISED